MVEQKKLNPVSSRRELKPVGRGSLLVGLPTSFADLDHEYFERPQIFLIADFKFPYLYRFPGQEKNERILFATREAKILHLSRLILTVITGLILWLVTVVGLTWLGEWWGTDLWWGTFSLVALEVVGICFSCWWQQYVYDHSVGLVTTMRLLKLVQTSPWNSYCQCLPLDKIVDTSATCHGLWCRLFDLNTFTARSSATSSGVATRRSEQGRINRKYFYLDNIRHASDLEHYLNKLLHLGKNKSPAKMIRFRPFIVTKKGVSRQHLIRQYPEFWS